MGACILLFIEFSSYEGEWRNGMRDGYGKYVWPDRSYYDG